MTAWRTDTPETVGMKTEVISSIIGWLDNLKGANIHSIVIARNGALILECYRHGHDERWRVPLGNVSHSFNVKHDIRSVTKVIVGLLIGKALEDRVIPNLDVPVFDYFPEYADLRTPQKDLICLRHLLTMSAGLEWNENLPATDPDNGEIRMWKANDRFRTALETPLIFPPGAVWNYSGACTELLAAIIRKVSGKPIDQYAQDVLFTPLAISDVEWARHKDGSPSASGGLRMCSPDLAKIGQIVVSRGQWNGKQILPSEWIKHSLEPQIGMDDRLFYYGYHWWLGRSLVSDREIVWAAGIGLGGQRLFVVPDLKLVTVITAGHYMDGFQAWLPLVIFNRYVLGALI